MKKLVYSLLSVMTLIAWIYALLERFTNQDWIMFIIDVFVPPIAVIDGIGMYFEYW